MPRHIKDQRIVIVEDDSSISEGLEVFLRKLNTVRTFGSAEEAIEAESSFEGVSVFILDYKLPGMNGIALFERLRASVPAAKFVLITGEMTYELAEETRKLGLDALMLKPFDLSIFEDNIAALLSLAG